MKVGSEIQSWNKPMKHSHDFRKDTFSIVPALAVAEFIEKDIKAMHKGAP